MPQKSRPKPASVGVALIAKDAAKTLGKCLASIDPPYGPNCYQIRAKKGGFATRLDLAWPLPCGRGPDCHLDSHGHLTCLAPK